MANLSGISPTELTLYQIWQIADHIMVNVPNGLPITDWQKKNMKTIMYLNDLVFYHDFSNEEMSKLLGGLYLKKIYIFLCLYRIRSRRV
jgi:hypothetical protein